MLVLSNASGTKWWRRTSSRGMPSHLAVHLARRLTTFIRHSPATYTADSSVTPPVGTVRPARSSTPFTAIDDVLIGIENNYYAKEFVMTAALDPGRPFTGSE